MDYWALGHIHKHAVLSTTQPTAVYCGNPQGRDPGETEPRGCYLVPLARHLRLDLSPDEDGAV
jgi:DNA repair exonuclease SbcCD nuclease subunit